MNTPRPRSTTHPRPRIGSSRGSRLRLSVLLAAVMLALAAASVVISQALVARAGGNSGIRLELTSGESLTSSPTAGDPAGDYVLTLRQDGGLVEESRYQVYPTWETVYGGGTDPATHGGNRNGGIFGGPEPYQIWSAAGTAGHPGDRAVMQDDGNFVVYGADGTVLWSTGTAGHPGAALLVQADADVVVRGTDGRPVWANNKVSIVDSGQPQVPVDLHFCPYGLLPENACGLSDPLGNGTEVTMRCWLSSDGEKWFFVTVQSGAYAATDGYLKSEAVPALHLGRHNQIGTPQCIMDSDAASAPPGPTPAAPSAAPSSSSSTATTGAATAGGDPPATTPPPQPATTPSRTRTPRTEPPGTQSSGGTAPSTPAGSGALSEESGTHGSPTFEDPYNASAQGPTIPPMTTVTVLCRVYAPQIRSAKPDGWWYRIGTAPWNGSYYAVANTFWNGDTPGQTPYTHNTDWNVPVC